MIAQSLTRLKRRYEQIKTKEDGCQLASIAENSCAVRALARLREGASEEAAELIEQTLARARREELRLILLEALWVSSLCAAERLEWHRASNEQQSQRGYGALCLGVRRARRWPMRAWRRWCRGQQEEQRRVGRGSS